MDPSRRGTHQLIAPPTKRRTFRPCQQPPRPWVRDDFSGVVAEVVEELDAAGIPPSLERVWRAGDKGKRIKSVSERLAPKKITRTRVEAELRTLGKTLEKNRPKKSREKSPK